MKNMKSILSVTMLVCLNLMMVVPTVSAGSISIEEQAVTTHYPARFYRSGIISSIDKVGIVVDNVYIPFASKVQFMTPDNEKSSLEPFTPGKRAGYIVNPEGHITVLCLFRESEEGS